MKIDAKFIPWLLYQAHRQDPVGDIARDVRQDMEDRQKHEKWIRSEKDPRWMAPGGEKYVRKDGAKYSWTWKDLLRRVHPAPRVCRMAALQAAQEWKQSPFIEFTDPPTTAGVYCASYLYTLEFVKIGKASNIRRRIGGLVTGSLGGVVLRAILSVNPEDEAKFHKKFKKHRLHGEWFSAELLKDLPPAMLSDTPTRAA